MDELDEEDEPEVCVHCKRVVVFGRFVVGEWAHARGSSWCQDANGFTATPLRRAQPTYHGAKDVL